MLRPRVDDACLGKNRVPPPFQLCITPDYSFVLFLSSGGLGKIKRKLTTLPRIFIRVVCRFNSVAFATQRQLAYPSDSTVVMARADPISDPRYNPPDYSFIFSFTHIHLLSSLLDKPCGRRWCRPFSPPVLAFNFFSRKGFSSISLLVDFSSSVLLELAHALARSAK